MSKQQEINQKDKIADTSVQMIDYQEMKKNLAEERKKEYNLFLQGQAHTRRLKRGTSPITDKVKRRINTLTSTHHVQCNSAFGAIVNIFMNRIAFYQVDTAH